MNDVHKLDFKFDVKKLNESLDWILEQADIDRVNQLCLTHARSATKVLALYFINIKQLVMV
jgi:hypothetical protein